MNFCYKFNFFNYTGSLNILRRHTLVIIIIKIFTECICSVCRIINQEDTAIIREVYDNDNSQEMFEQELDNALEAGYKYIIIEPTQLADETVRWITVGNFLSQTAIISSALSAGTGLEIWNYIYLVVDSGFLE